MDEKKQEKWAIFWCELLSPIIYEDIDPEQVHEFLKMTTEQEVVFPDGQMKRPSLSTLKRKLSKYKKSGFKGLFRKPRKDRGQVRCVASGIIEKAVAIKKEQPRRSHTTINRILDAECGTTLSRSTLYHHLKQCGATRLKLGITNQKVRKRWTRDHTHDLWVGDFEEGPYVLDGGEVVPTYLSAFIDCHSRYVVEGRYYFRQNLDILIDSLIRALSKHGAPLAFYLDNAKIYHAHGLKTACFKMNTRLLHRPVKDAAPGGLIERFFETVQDQFESEVRAGDILGLEQLNRTFSAWLAVSHHQTIHSETRQTPEDRYQTGLRGIRRVDMKEIISSFMTRVERRVNRTFSDIQLNKRFYKVDPTLRGDKVRVAFDPFTTIDEIEVYSLKNEYLGSGTRHFRESGQFVPPSAPGKPKHNYLDILLQKHQQSLDQEVCGIDYRKMSDKRPWQFHQFAKTIGYLLGRKGSLTSFSADELESLRKVYNQSTGINQEMVRQATANAEHKTLPWIIMELKKLIHQKEEN